MLMSKTLKKCPYCNSDYEFDDDFSFLLKYGPTECCDECKEIHELKTLLKDYDTKQKEKEWKNEIHEKNMVRDTEQHVQGVTSYTSLFYKNTYEAKNRTKYITELINEIDHARRFLAFDVAAQFEILDSIYEKKDIFWEETGNFLRYVHNASFEYVVIKIKELLSGSDSKYSIKRFKNIFVNEKTRIFGRHHIIETFIYENGDSFSIKYDPFPIVEYLNKIEKTLDNYSEIINAIADYRDNNFAHIGKLKSEESSKNLSYVNLKRIYSMVKLIYDGFLFAIAPDKYTHLLVKRNILLDHMNQVVSVYRKFEKEQEQKLKMELLNYGKKK